MVQRNFWIESVERAWSRKSVLWLSGVRRVGKTFLCQSLKNLDYYDCELPRVRRQLDDLESFLAGHRGRRVALDEVHRLDNPSEVLKIAADHFPDVRVIATGSATLEASSRFRDTLTGRKVELRLTPMIWADLESFGNLDIPHRLLHGGLPPFFLASEVPEHDYQEWLDSYWARDIQTLFRLERRYSFQRFLELLFVDSGGMFEASRFTGPCEISRATVSNYLAVMEATGAVTIVRPYATRRSTEIISAPKVYGFDTGFICFYRAWQQLRPDDYGVLWEHFVLNELAAHLPSREIRYWRDKRGHEIDFVMTGRRSKLPVAIECKWSASQFKGRSLRSFRDRYPDGDNWLVAHDVASPYVQRVGSIEVRFLGIQHLRDMPGRV